MIVISLLIAAGIFGILAILNYYTGMLNGLNALLFGPPPQQIHTRPEAARHQLRRRQWRAGISLITKWRLWRARKDAENLATDALAETLSTFQDAMEEMTGDAPSTYEVTKELLYQERRRS